MHTHRLPAPHRSLAVIALFLLAVASGVLLLRAPLERAFFANPAFNGLILAVLLAGVAVTWRRVAALGREARWLRHFRRGGAPARERGIPPPRLLAPLARLLAETGGERQAVLAPTTLRAILDGVAGRVEESRELSRYLFALLIFLGLLGTFWGLLETIAAASAVIAEQPASGESLAWFEGLRRGLERPLAGMATAFSTSLFGLAGALVLGFLDLLASRAQNRFLVALEDGLSAIARLPGGALAEAESPVPSYLEALLASVAESLDRLQRLVAEGERGRSELGERIGLLAAELGGLREAIADQAHERERLGRALDALEQALRGREALAGAAEAIRDELRLLARTLGRALEARRDGRPA